MILLIDTADQKKLWVGISENKSVIAQMTVQAEYRQAEKLMPTVTSLLRKTKLDLAELTGVAVVSGPGPFTALRIGVVTANALGYALGLPVAGVLRAKAETPNELATSASPRFAASRASLGRAADLALKHGKVGAQVLPKYGKEPNITMSKK